MNILCRIGLHRWRALGFTGLVMPAQVQQCARCKRGRAIHWDYVETYTPEQMGEMIAAAPKQEPTP